MYVFHCGCKRRFTGAPFYLDGDGERIEEPTSGCPEAPHTTPQITRRRMPRAVRHLLIGFGIVIGVVAGILIFLLVYDALAA
jgi:hypothetical protein